MDESRELTEVESGSIMSVGRLTSDILERPVSQETQTEHQSKTPNVVAHAHKHTNTQTQS